MSEKISLAGDLGSGKSTVSKILIERLGAEYYCTGSIVRGIADSMNMTVVELNHYMETHPEIDAQIDDGLKKLSDDERLLIIDSRMAWHFTKGTFKVYLSTDIETSALRIMSACRKGEHTESLEETIKDTRARRLSEQKRYMTQYGVDIKNLQNYDLIVDTTKATPEEVAQVIIDSFKKWQSDKSQKFCYLSPERLNYIDDEPNQEKVQELSSKLEMGEDIEQIEVFERDGEFYVENGLEATLAYAFSMVTYVPCKLIEGTVGNRNYVKMKNSI